MQHMSMDVVLTCVTLTVVTVTVPKPQLLAVPFRLSCIANVAAAQLEACPGGVVGCCSQRESTKFCSDITSVSRIGDFCRRLDWFVIVCWRVDCAAYCVCCVVWQVGREHVLG